ncbi:MAG: hypothetical protein DYG83_18230 [Candidatus Brocadia sp. AMX2]|uniref:Uncharacterized protein n=1 Tax=Candidatus Brocadia sinica JPN1 TaxID=1197129 RepID=A0ABQ0JXG8_9BACT|nr:MULTISPECIES: hypothetical protein [Brocadia]MBC6934161.1 hypothetical protein [Candidatus Brocadia sp.]MBL1169760.1 hypothetical protein [Candidatus Brocadia sp. AMX1]MCK6467888.1 hypothetical protein [Candidatus Brocadia sinica]NOG40728.1 hypothetical protein [Planctomycetota bacterium]KAA0241121.1 MAG: hypothetical protein EDM70_18680 [Candidatus Brocadia sp. AMX2]
MKVSDLTIEEFEELLRKTIEDEIEDLYIMLDPTIKAKIEEGLADIREGKVVSLDDLIARRKANPHFSQRVICNIKRFQNTIN